jgi:hypothetical protein
MNGLELIAQNEGGPGPASPDSELRVTPFVVAFEDGKLDGEEPTLPEFTVQKSHDPASSDEGESKSGGSPSLVMAGDRSDGVNHFLVGNFFRDTRKGSVAAVGQKNSVAFGVPTQGGD